MVHFEIKRMKTKQGSLINYHTARPETKLVKIRSLFFVVFVSIDSQIGSIFYISLRWFREKKRLFLRANLNKRNRPYDLYNVAHFHTFIFPYDDIRWIQTLLLLLAFEFNEYRCCFYYHRFISIIYDGSQSWLDMTTIYTF